MSTTAPLGAALLQFKTGTEGDRGQRRWGGELGGLIIVVAIYFLPRPPAPSWLTEGGREENNAALHGAPGD
jgi:hypothetical protein